MEVPIKIFTACTNGNVELVQQLIASGLDINEPQFSTKSTPVHLASISGKRRVLKLLLRSGALVDAVDKVGRTALHHAAAWNNERTAKDLIKFRTNVNAQATDGKTPLAIAAHKGCARRSSACSSISARTLTHLTRTGVARSTMPSSQSTKSVWTF